MAQYFLSQTVIVLVLCFVGMSPVKSQLPLQTIAQDASSESLDHSPSKGQADLLLYGGPRTRSPLVQWYLEELAVPYRYISLDIKAEEHRQPQFLAINPMGKVPAIVDGDFKLWESGAILLYLAEKYGKMPDTIEDRSVINQWVIFANTTLGPGLFREDRRERELPRLLPPLNNTLEQQPFILGADLSVVDVAVGSYLHYARVVLSLEFTDYPAIEVYLKRLSGRPAFKKTLGQC